MHLFLLGGFGATSDSATVQVTSIRADGSLGAWRTTTPLPQTREGAGAAVAAGRVYVFAGKTVDVVWSAPILGSGDLGAWRVETSLANRRYHPVAFAGPNRVYVGGGTATDPCVHQDASFEEADIGPDGVLSSWRPSASMNLPRYGAAATTIGDSAIVVGGVSGGCSPVTSTEATSCPNCEPDRDGDGALDGADNCPDDPNPDQANADSDSRGDVCDPCPGDPLDDAVDGDGVCGDIDNCADVANAGQEDADADGAGDACDSDDDGDGVADSTEPGFCKGSLPGEPTTSLGCTVAQVCPCAAHLGRSGWNKRAEYLRCVKETANEMLDEQRSDRVVRGRVVKAAQAGGCGG